MPATLVNRILHLGALEAHLQSRETLLHCLVECEDNPVAQQKAHGVSSLGPAPKKNTTESCEIASLNRNTHFTLTRNFRNLSLHASLLLLCFFFYTARAPFAEYPWAAPGSQHERMGQPTKNAVLGTPTSRTATWPEFVPQAGTHASFTQEVASPLTTALLPCWSAFVESWHEA